MLIHFCCLCLLGLDIKLNFNISKGAVQPHITSTPLTVVLKGHIFGRTIYPPSVIVKAL